MGMCRDGSAQRSRTEWAEAITGTASRGTGSAQLVDAIVGGTDERYVLIVWDSAPTVVPSGLDTPCTSKPRGLPHGRRTPPWRGSAWHGFCRAVTAIAGGTR